MLTVSMKYQKQQIVYLSDMPNGGSDIALKRNVRLLENVLNKVLALRPVTWRWKDDTDPRVNYGFIAQEVEKIMPDLVTEEAWKNGDQVKFLSTNGMVPYAIGAIKEQQKEIRKLLATLKKQQKEIDTLKRTLEKLKG